MSASTRSIRRHTGEITRIGTLGRIAGRTWKRRNGPDLTQSKSIALLKNRRHEKDAVEVAEYAYRHGFEIRFIREMDLARGIFYKVDGGDGGKCSTCNRIRLTATGDVKPCLFNSAAWNIRELGPLEALIRAIREKPACGTSNKTGHFSTIGG